MSIESELERISSAKTAIISAINEQLNGETVPSGIKVEGLAAYIISACDIQYNLGLGGGGGQGGGGASYVVSGPYMDNIQGTYAPYDTSGYGGTQTYKLVNGDYYMYRFCEDEPGWCIREGGIGDIEVPGGGIPSGTLIYIWNSSTTPPIGTWSDGFSVTTA